MTRLKKSLGRCCRARRFCSTRWPYATTNSRTTATFYAATRSPGKLRKGLAAFQLILSIGPFVSWKFEPIGEWPFVLITSPSDERLVINRRSPTDPSEHIDGSHLLTIAATDSNGRVASDRTTTRAHQLGIHRASARYPLAYGNVLGEWRDGHISGAQLGPNEYGRHWPSRRERAAR